MSLQNLKSDSAQIYDNTDDKIILVPPSVLDNKLRDFEENIQAKSTISSDVALAITLLIAVLTSTFHDFTYLEGSTIRGSFLTGFIVVLIKIGYSAYRIFYKNKQGRTYIINSLQKDELKNNKIK